MALAPILFNDDPTTSARVYSTLAYDSWDKLPAKLQGLGTRVVIIGPDGYMFDLAGPHAGRQGVRLAKSLQGEHHWPFEILVTEGAYQMGLTIERTNYKAREVNAGITIGGHAPVHLNEFQYRWASDRFWGQLQQDRNSWLGIFTRYSGWRWTQVRLKHTVDTAQSMDEMAFGNNTSTWDVTLVAPKPWYAKRMKFDTWDFARTDDNPAPDDDGDPTTGTIPLANGSDLPAWPKGIIVGAGDVEIQDGLTGNSVPFKIYPTDGSFVYFDTDPEEVTLVAANDPVDNVFYDRLRASRLLEAFLHNITGAAERIDLRLEQRFHSSVPPNTVANIRVRHSNPNAKITVFMPQHYKRSR